MTTPFNVFAPDCNSFLVLRCSASNARTLESIHIGLANESEMRGGLRLGIGRDSANDVGADGDGAEAIANINNVCLLRGRAGCDRGCRRFIQQTQKMGEKCDEQKRPTWFSSQFITAAPQTGVFIKSRAELSVIKTRNKIG